MKVSIILSVYNKKKYLDKCISSILNQRYKNFELIIVDDGSTDGSSDIIDEYAANDKRVVVLHKKNAGVSSARNDAIDMAAGDYIQFVDADDYVPKDSTEILITNMKKYKVDLVVANYYRVVKKYFSKKGDIKTTKILDKISFSETMMKNPANYYYGVLWNKLYKSSIIKKYNIKMKEDLKWCEDFVFNMEYIQHIKYVLAISKAVYYYVNNDDSLVTSSMNLPDIINMKFKIFEYYSSFYKNIYNKKEYILKIPNIYKFFIDFSKDHFIGLHSKVLKNT